MKTRTLLFNTHENEKQKQVARYWVDNETSDIVYGGSKGSGKSFLLVSLIFGDAFIYPGTHYFIARVSLTNIRKFTIPSIYEVFSIWGVSEKEYRYNGQDNYFELNNGSKVFLLDADYQPRDPLFMRFGSMQMTRGAIEEGGEFVEAAKNNLAASIGRWKNDIYKLHPKLLTTCNPSKNYLYREYYRKHRDGCLEHWKKFIQALPTDNKKLPDGYLENLERSLSKNEAKRLLKGDWEYDTDDAKLIEYDKIIDCFSNKGVLPGDKKLTVDLARLGGDKIVAIKSNGFIMNVEWWSREYLDISGDRIESIRIGMGIGKSDVLVDEDGLGGGVVDFMKYKGFVNNSMALPSPTAPYNDKGQQDKENYDNLKSQCSFRMADRINKNGIYLICETEIKDFIIEEMEQVKQKELDSDLKKGVVSKKVIKEALGRSPDFWDAIMMREYFELKPKVEFMAAKY